MRIEQMNRWDVSPAQAIEIQQSLRKRVVTVPYIGEVKTVAGVDVGVRGNTARAAVVVLSYPDLVVVDKAVADLAVTFPYIPGLLSFRETPAVLQAFEKLSVDPDLVIVDGQGYAHPRRFGIACHIGVLIDRPTIGCAKSRLIGTHAEPGAAFGSWVELRDAGEVIGAAVRSKDGASPLYVSIGHKVDLPTAIHYVLSCCRGHRLPETSRQAHLAASGATDGGPSAIQGTLF